jgi:hypothetical protein
MQLDGVANLNFQGHLISGLFCDFVLNIKNRWIFSYINFSVFIKQSAAPVHPMLKRRRAA